MKLEMKGILSLVGFLMFSTGIVGLVLSLVGVRLSVLSFIESANPMLGFLFKLFLCVAGIILVIVARTDWKKENQA